LGLSERDRKTIEEYIADFVDISWIGRLASSTAFLFSADASWRILAYLVGLYYGATEFGRASEVAMDARYGILIFSYAFISFLAFFLTDRPLTERNKRSFLWGMYLLLAGLAFVLIKVILYLRLQLWQVPYGFSALFWVQLFIFFFAGLSLAKGLSSWPMVNLVLGVLAQHQRGGRERKG
jgi:hypothetical protein